MMPDNEVCTQNMEVIGTVHVTYICRHFVRRCMGLISIGEWYKNIMVINILIMRRNQTHV